MNAWILWACDTVKARRGMADDRTAMKVKEASLILICYSVGSQWSCLVDVSEKEREECRITTLALWQIS